MPVIVSQVFNVNEAELLADDRKAVRVLPPMSQQMSAWQEIDPGIRNIGAVVGRGHEDLIEEANLAAAEHGIKFHYAIANSDRETLYLFDGWSATSMVICCFPITAFLAARS